MRGSMELGDRLPSPQGGKHATVVLCGSDGSRRRRIAGGSGVTPQDVNQLLNQFRLMQKLMKMGGGGKLPKNLMGIFR